MKCTGCHKSFEADELDSDSFCYDCSNYDPEPSLTIDQAVAEAVKSVLEGIAYRAGSKVKVDSGGAS